MTDPEIERRQDSAVCSIYARVMSGATRLRGRERYALTSENSIMHPRPTLQSTMTLGRPRLHSIRVAPASTLGRR